MESFRLSPQHVLALVIFLIALILLIRLAFVHNPTSPSVSSSPTQTVLTTPDPTGTDGSVNDRPVDITALPRPTLPSDMPTEGTAEPLIPITSVPIITGTLLAETATPPIQTPELPLATPTAPPVAALPPATETIPPESDQALLVSPTPSPTPTPVPSVRPRLINNEIVPGWWPCQEGEIKAIRKLAVYYMPEQHGYARSYANIECFATAQDAVAAGYQRGE